MPATLVSAVLLVVELAATALVAVRVTRWLLPDEPGDRLEPATVGLFAGLLTIVVVSQTTAALGLFSRWWVLGAHLALLGLVRWRVPAPAPAPGPEATDRAGRWRPSVDAVAAMAVGSVGVGLLGVGAYFSLRQPTTEYDSLQYHMPNAVHWVQAHSIWHLPLVSPPFATNAYPSNGELTSAWSMLATRGSHLAMMQPLASGLLLVLAAAMLARRLGGRAWLGALATLTVLLGPILYRNVDSLMSDYAGAAGVVLALALLLRARHCQRPVRCVVFAGLALGWSVGSKDTAIVYVVFIVGWLLIVAPDRLRSRLAQAGVFLGGVLVPSGIWFLRDGLALGNPVFPAGVSVFGRTLFSGTSSPYTAYRATMLSHVLHRDRLQLHEWWTGVSAFVGPAAGLCVLGTAAAIVVAVRRRDRRVGAVAAIVALGLLAYLVTPYTGGGGGRALPAQAVLIAAQLRYVLVAMVVGAVLLVVILPRWLALAAVAYPLAFGYARGVPLITELHHSRALTITILVAIQAAVLAVVLVAARRFGGWPGTSAWLRSATGRSGHPARAGAPLPLTRRLVPGAVVATGGALVAVGAATAVVAAAVTFPRAYPPVLAARVPPKAKVLQMGVPDVTQLLGPRLGRRLLSVGSGPDGNAFPDRATFLRFVAAHRPAAIIISPALEIVDPRYLTDVVPPPQQWSAVGIIRSPVVGPLVVYAPR